MWKEGEAGAKSMVVQRRGLKGLSTMTLFGAVVDCALLLYGTDKGSDTYLLSCAFWENSF